MEDRGYIWKALLMAALVLVCWGGLSFRLCELHLGRNEYLKDRIRRLHTVEQTILVGRGRIFDRNNKLLALDLPVRNIFVDPQTILSNGTGRAVSGHLARLLGVPVDQVWDRVNRPGRRYEVVARLVKDETAEKIERLRMAGVHFEPLTTRYYPHDAMACHVVGFSNLEGVGSAGIEQRWNAKLKGSPGLRQSEKDGRRRELYTRRSLEVAPQEGADLHLTLDQNVQYFVESALDRAMSNESFHCEAAWAVVEDVRTGEILGMASRPAYDLNAYGKTALEERRNRAISVNFEPGSVFKVGVVAAAMNEGIIASNDVFDCEMGMWHYAGRPLRDFHAYGELDVTGILRKSSNIGAAKIAVMLGEARLYRYLRAFGLGSLTGIELPGEEAGLLAPVSRWSKIDITRIAMGHSVAVNALQMLNVLCCIGNDGFLMKPYLVSRVVDKNGVVLEERKPEARARVLTERTAAQMREMLKEVTRPGGTGTRAAIPGYAVAGKTGTAEKLVNGHYDGRQNVSSFMGLLPADRPEIGIIVVLDNPQPLRTGGVAAAPVFSWIAEPLAHYLDIRPLTAGTTEYYQPVSLMDEDVTMTGEAAFAKTEDVTE